MKWWKPKYGIWLLALLSGCAGFQRGCASGCATSFGADWIVVQQRGVDGKPYNCWLLQDVSISNEQASDGIYWLEPSGHLVHIAGQYARVQVTGKQFKTAAKLIGVDAELCRGGAYPTPGIDAEAEKEETK